MDYKEFFTTENKSGWKCVENKLKNKYPELVSNINEFCKTQLLENIPFKVKVYHFIHNLNEIPKCKTCDKHVNFSGNLKDGYNDYCSVKCSANNSLTKEKLKETSIKKYDTTHPSKAKKVREKYIKTCIDKYGVENVSQVDEINKKREKTITDKYGVNSYLKLDICKEQLKEYSIKKLNVPHISKSNDIKEKKITTLIKNFGVSNPMFSENIKYKQKNTLIKNFNVSNPMFSPELKNKCVTNMINTKFNNFVLLNNVTEKIISWDKLYLNIICDDCSTEYTISRELYVLRKNRGVNICTTCNPLYNKKISYGQKELQDFITTLNIKYETNNRSILNGKELDIFLPDKNIAIEYNGLYWHSELFVDKNYHINKTNLCNDKGVRLIHIFEDEWLFKPDIVKSRIKNILGLTQNKIYARKCIIKEINSDLTREFLDNNHIQGNVASKIKIGLYYNNELVSLMTFAQSRTIMGGKPNEYELIRFSNKLNTNIIGGASKLLKYFIKTYEPKKLISYADLRWSTGNLYNELGFKFIHNSKPNYWYVTNDKRKHRYGYRKSILIKEGYDSNKSEHQIMLERGIHRIYDCGNKLYELTFD